MYSMSLDACTVLFYIIMFMYMLLIAKSLLEELRKVFVGMLGKCTRVDVERMFQQFGPIEELTVLQDRDGVSKRCAFIKFASRQQAQKAINEMHGSEIMPVSSLLQNYYVRV